MYRITRALAPCRCLIPCLNRTRRRGADNTFAQALTCDNPPGHQAPGLWAAGALYSAAVEFVPRLSAVQIVVTPPPGGQRVTGIADTLAFCGPGRNG